MNSKIFHYFEYDAVSQMLGTGYNRFESFQGVGGLAKEKGNRLDILAVHSLVQGRGMFREFIKAAKQHYDTICVWEVWNENLPEVLKRYGFQPETELQGDGQVLTGFRWDSIKKPTKKPDVQPNQNPLPEPCVRPHGHE